MMSGQAAHLFVRGMVQGVWFRASTEQEARRRELTGWVRNCADGSVEIHAEGPAEPLAAFIEWCRKGPPLARVEQVDIDWVDPAGMTTFEIR